MHHSPMVGILGMKHGPTMPCGNVYKKDSKMLEIYCATNMGNLGTLCNMTQWWEFLERKLVRIEYVVSPGSEICNTA